MKISLPCFGIVLEENSIASELHEEDAPPSYNAAMDAVESLILAHHCAGIDVNSPAYTEGLETAVQAIAHNSEDDPV